jgi:iron complex transport system ATP-binding protein
MTLLHVSQCSAGYGPCPVLQEVELEIAANEMIGLIGPNGAGKTTLLRVMAGDLRPMQGRLLLDGRPIDAWPRRERARWIAYVPPALDLTTPLSVEEYVSLGRTPYVQGWQPMSSADRLAVRSALAATDMESFRDRDMRALSEGEKHRALLALGLAQEPRLLLLDEPTAHLDIKYAWRFMEMIHELHRIRDITIVLTSHDLNISAAFCHRLVLLERGRIAEQGPPAKVLQQSVISRVYDYPVEVLHTPGNPPRVFPVRTA